MIERITIANSKPWCPYCADGYMLLHEVALHATPEVASDVEFKYSCNVCFRDLTFFMSEITARGHNSIGIAIIRELGEKRAK